MSDGLVVLASIFALMLIYSATRIVIALINRRPAESARLTAIENQLSALARDVVELRESGDLREQELARLADAQRFTDTLLASERLVGPGPDSSPAQSPAVRPES